MSTTHEDFLRKQMRARIDADRWLKYADEITKQHWIESCVTHWKQYQGRGEDAIRETMKSMKADCLAESRSTGKVIEKSA